MEDRTRTAIRCVEHMRDLDRLAATFVEVWGLDPSSSIASPDIMRAIAHSGGYLAAAVDEDGTFIGGSMGFRGVHDGRPSLHSHVTGVIAARAGAGVGRALKQHQRAWARRSGLACITWTFDPLVRRNAWFNLHVLGADANEYLVDFYGPLRDGINGDDATDRLLAVWWVDGERATAADTGPLPAVTDLRDAVARLDCHDDQPVLRDGDVSLVGVPVDTLLVAVPDDIVTLRHRDRPLADRWRLALRHALEPAMAAGWSIEGLTSTGLYVLRRPSIDAHRRPSTDVPMKGDP